MFMAELAVIYADWGKRSEAKSVHTELLARAAREYVSPFLLALIRRRSRRDRRLDAIRPPCLRDSRSPAPRLREVLARCQAPSR
jgi:hypothetical protein